MIVEASKSKGDSKYFFELDKIFQKHVVPRLIGATRCVKPGQEKGEVALPRDARLMMSLLHTMGVVSNLLLLPYGVGASI